MLKQNPPFLRTQLKDSRARSELELNTRWSLQTGQKATSTQTSKSSFRFDTMLQNPSEKKPPAFMYLEKITAMSIEANPDILMINPKYGVELVTPTAQLFRVPM